MSMKLSDAAEGAWLFELVKSQLETELALRELLTMQILKDEFGFSEDQLTRYAELKMQKMKELREKQS